MRITKKRQLNVKKLIGYLIGLAVFSTLIYIGGLKAIKTTLSPHLSYLLLSFFSMLIVFVISSIRGWRAGGIMAAIGDTEAGELIIDHMKGQKEAIQVAIEAIKKLI